MCGDSELGRPDLLVFVITLAGTDHPDLLRDRLGRGVDKTLIDALPASVVTIASLSPVMVAAHSPIGPQGTASAMGSTLVGVAIGALIPWGQLDPGLEGFDVNPRFHRLHPEGHPDHGMAPSDLTEPETFTTEDHRELNHTVFQTDDESVLAGVWECAPCYEEIESYPVHEMMTVLSGSVTMTDGDGHAETFSAGDTFFVAKGTKCTWHITETLRKYYMIAE